MPGRLVGHSMAVLVTDGVERADCGHMPRNMDADRGGRRDGPMQELVAIAQDRSRECRRHLGLEVVVSDRGVVTSRRLDGVPAFNKKMIHRFREGAA